MSDALLLDDFDEDYNNYASLGARCGASILDAIIIGIPSLFLMFYNYILFHSLLIACLSSFIYPFYKIYLEGKYGYTLGKKILGFKIINLNGDNKKMNAQRKINIS